MSPTSRVLFAHERRSVARAASHVLQARGFHVDTVRDGEAAVAALRANRYGALVVDVALPLRPGYELVDIARAEARRSGGGADVVVLVASVFRKTSYKRRPARLYGADDYVELHHLGDMLPDKLARLLRVPASQRPSERVGHHAVEDAERRVTEAVYQIGDARFDDEPVEDLAALIVADVVLYNGDRIAETQTLQDARTAVADDLDVATDLVRQVFATRGESADAGAAIRVAFDTLLRSMGRREGVA